MIQSILGANTTADTSNSRPTYKGIIDPNGEIRLRLGVIDNPTIQRSGPFPDPVDPTKVINMHTGKVCIRWVDGQGGYLGWEGPANSKNPNNYGISGKDAQSDVEQISLTHPMIWAGVDKCNNPRWCGFNYIPPLGSLVIVGFRKSGFPLLLGYVQAHYADCKPIKPGEIMIKGFGNNYTHYQQLHKMEHRVWFNANSDVTNYNCGAKSSVGRTFRITLDAEAQNITVQGTNTKGFTSSLVVRAEDILMSSNKGNNGSSIAISPGAIQLNSAGAITINGKAIYLN